MPMWCGSAQLNRRTFCCWRPTSPRGVEDKDISARCDIAIEVRRQRPECRVYLVCAAGHPEKLPALDKAVELKLIHGYFIGDLTARQMRAWIAETSEAMGRQERRQRDLRKGEQP